MSSRSAMNLVGCLLLSAVGCALEENDWQVQLRSLDANVRREAIRDAEGSADSAVAVKALEPLLADEDATVRIAAGLAVLRIDRGNSACRPAIEQALRKGHGPTFIAVGNCGGEAAWAVPTLVSLLSDRRANIRALAAKTLGQFGEATKELEAALQRGLRDESELVRKATQESLAKIRARAVQTAK